MSKHLNSSDKSDIVKCYIDSPKTISAVAEHFNISSPTVIKILDMYQVKRWSRAKQYSPELDDGSYGYYPRSKHNVHRKLIRMCSGSKRFMQEFIETLSEEINIAESSIRYSERDHTYTCGWSNNDDMWVLIKFIYSTDGPYMIRKKRKLQIR